MTETTPKPRLTLDITPLLEDEWTGISVFTRRLAQALERSGRVELDYGIRMTRIAAPEVRETIRHGSGSFLRGRINGRPSDAFEPIDSSLPLLYPSVKENFGLARREASTIHDISTLVMPETHDQANVAYHLEPLRDQITSDEVVFCVSEATRAALSDTFPWVAPKTRLLMQYADWPEHFPLLDRNQPTVELGRYAVVIGTIEPRKNLDLLLRALEHPSVIASDLTFIVIGRRGWLADQALARLRPQAQQKVKFTGFVSEFVKYRLLKAAEFLILTSVYEGFGIPAVEAMSLGKPVLASLTSSFPEVIGDGGVFFDPFSVDEFAAGLKEISDPRRIAELAPLALQQAASFTPDRMAAPVLEWIGA
ncbi:glycosyltransferase family 4 protein [Roseomonas sp. SSH11]|uniref:Glycosyltransferase family 4 protein n=1 Tax=Pararoseomonas baculiformis TaxID=2820812 RepID=A0ABS4ABZ4_9PROT|nr:glycosyltransferase family 1 protein [Pararoseomonas baculiformis]MBP0444528.1 glycosyltransferase family 4 protein [Pararoseomonas baculiformis]